MTNATSARTFHENLTRGGGHNGGGVIMGWLESVNWRWTKFP